MHMIKVRCSVKRQEETLKTQTRAEKQQDQIALLKTEFKESSSIPHEDNIYIISAQEYRESRAGCTEGSDYMYVH